MSTQNHILPATKTTGGTVTSSASPAIAPGSAITVRASRSEIVDAAAVTVLVEWSNNSASFTSPVATDTFTIPVKKKSELATFDRKATYFRVKMTTTEAAVLECWADESDASAEIIEAILVDRLDGEYRLVDYGVVDTTGATDSNAAWAACIAAWSVGGGGTIVLPGGTVKVTAQTVIPSSTPSATGMLRQPPLVIRGTGGHAAGQVNLGAGGTRLLLTYQGAGTSEDAAIVSYGSGVLVFDNFVMQDTTAGTETPFLYTTGTTVKVLPTFAALGADTRYTCKKDFWVAGGTRKFPTAPVYPATPNYGSVDAPFQGYGSSVVGAYFNRVRRVVYGRSYANQIVIRDNFFDKDCGSNLAGGACIEFDASLTADHPGDPCASNVIVGNYFENTGHIYGIKLKGGAYTKIAFNGFEDSGASYVAAVRLEGHTISSVNYPSVNNSIVHNLVANGYPTISADAMSALTTSNNLLISELLSEGSVFPHVVNVKGLRIPDPSSTTFAMDDTSGATLLNISGAGRQWNVKGALYLDGKAGVAGSTYLTLGNNSTASDAVLTINPPTGQAGSIQFKRAGVSSWLLYDAGSAVLYLRDSVNGVMAVTYTAGATNTGSATFAGSVNAGRWVKSQAVATGSRPSASTAGAGAMMYDSTLSKPIWSDGTAWRDSAGTAV